MTQNDDGQRQARGDTNGATDAKADSPVEHRVAVPARRYLTILFTDLSDSTYLSGVMETEIYAAMLDDVRRVFRSAVESRGGSVNQFQGDGLQALFGHLEPTEFDVSVAVEAALEVHEQVRLLRGCYAEFGAQALSVHTGVHAGPALARAGDDVAGRVELFGPAPGLAKHLSDVAEADEILVSEDTLGPAAHLFETEAPRSLRLKGREAPFWVRRIVARSPWRTRFEAHAQRGLLPFVGRRAEVETLAAWWAQACAGQWVSGLVHAPPGAGKTRLIEAHWQHLASEGALVLKGYCDAYLRAEPWQPFLHMLRSYLRLAPDATAAVAEAALRDRLETAAPELRAHRAELLQALSLDDALPDGKRGDAQHIGGALAEVLITLARQQPIAIFIDDWQWADDATRQLLQRLQRHERHQNLSMLCVVAMRAPLAEHLVPTAQHVLALQPLPHGDSRVAVQGLLPGCDPFQADEIVRQSGGNPLFIEELCHHVQRSRAPLQVPSVGGAAWLESMVASRLAQLPPHQRRVLDAAAVIGPLVPTRLLEHLTGCGPEHPDVVALASQDLLFPSDEPALLRFKHGLTHDVAYASVGLVARRTAHAQVAAWLSGNGSGNGNGSGDGDADGDGDGDLAATAQPAGSPGAGSGRDSQAVEALAHHHAGAGDSQQAARYGVLAGDKAMAASAIDRAKAHYRAALAHMDRLMPLAEVYQGWRAAARRLGLACVYDPARGDLPVFERAMRLALDHQDNSGRAYAAYWLSYIHYALGESGPALAMAEKAWAAARAAADQRLVLQVQLLQGQALAAAGQCQRAADQLGKAIGVWLTVGLEKARMAPGFAYSLACRAAALGDLGRWDDALAEFDRAMSALPATGHEVEASVRCLRSNVLLGQERWAEALADAQAAERIAAHVRSLYLLAMSRALAAWASWQMASEAHSEVPRERPDQALSALADATQWLLAHDKRLLVSLNHGRLAEALLVSSQPALARQHAAAAVRRWRQGDPFGAPNAWRALARACAASGDSRRAAQRLKWAQRVAEQRGSVHEQALVAACRAELGL